VITNLKIILFSLLLISLSTQGLAISAINSSGYFEFVLVVVTIFGFFYSLHNANKIKSYLFLFGSLIIIICISGFINNSGLNRISRGMYVYVLVPYAIIILLLKPFDKKHFNILLNIFITIVSLNSVISIYRYYIDPTVGGIYKTFSRTTTLFRTGDLSAESIVFGPTMAVISAFFIQLYFEKRKKKYLFVFCLTAFSSILSLSRSSVFILLSITIFIVYKILKNSTYDNMFKFLILSIIVSPIIVYTIKTINIKSMLEEIGSFSELQTYSNRLSGFVKYYDLIKNDGVSKILFGLGPAYIQPSTLNEENRADSVIENYWITIIGEIGIFGFAAILVIYAKILIRKKIIFNIYNISLLAMFFVNVFAAPLLGIYTQVFVWSTIMIYKMRLFEVSSG
jgi:hypothetical protein